MKNTINFCTVVLLGLFLTLVPYKASSQENSTIKIGVLAKRGNERCLEKWGPTAEYLTESIGDYQFEIIPLAFSEINPAVHSQRVDFVLANSSIYVGLEVNYGVTRIATLKNKRLNGTHTTFGGVIFSLKKDHALRKINDLKGSSFMAVDETSFGGWRMAWRELQEHGLDPYSDFSSLTFGGTHDAVVFAVINGEVDAGTVRTDTLERMSLEGLVNLNELHVFHEHKGGKVHLPFLHSTREYPEWPFAKLPHVDKKLAEKVALELIKMPEDSFAAQAALSTGWTIPLNYQSVHDCLKALELPPYIKLPPTLKDIFLKIWPVFLGAISIICLLIIWICQYRRLIRKLQSINNELENALEEIKTLRGIIPICSYCKGIRSDEGSWTKIEEYIEDHSGAQFSHGICEDCLEKHFPELS